MSIITVRDPEPEQKLPAVSRAMTPMDMLQVAIERGQSIDILERLMNLNERWQQGQARKAFYDAKAAFKASAPAVITDKTNKQYDSSYSSIGNVVNTLNKALSEHGLDARWDFDQGEKAIKVTCVLCHRDGHSESVTLSGPPDVSGSKNPIQQIKSTLTYLKLATFEGVTGVATREGSKDDDGNAAGSAPITDEQADELIVLAEETNADRVKFCRYFKINSIAELPASKFAAAKKALEARRGQS